MEHAQPQSRWLDTPQDHHPNGRISAMSALVEHRLSQCVDLLKSLVVEIRDLRHEVSKINTTRGQHEELDPKATNQTGNTETGPTTRRPAQALALSTGAIVFAPKSAAGIPTDHAHALAEIRFQIQSWGERATREENESGFVIMAATSRGTETGLIIAEQIILEHSSTQPKE
jgi:hypothetical protein